MASVASVCWQQAVGWRNNRPANASYLLRRSPRSVSSRGALKKKKAKAVGGKNSRQTCRYATLSPAHAALNSRHHFALPKTSCSAHLSAPCAPVQHLALARRPGLQGQTQAVGRACFIMRQPTYHDVARDLLGGRIAINGMVKAEQRATAALGTTIASFILGRLEVSFGKEDQAVPPPPCASPPHLLARRSAAGGFPSLPWLAGCLPATMGYHSPCMCQNLAWHFVWLTFSPSLSCCYLHFLCQTLSGYASLSPILWLPLPVPA